jgi:hypothetical protein
MSNFLKQGPIPKWRVFFWGVVAATGLDAIAYFSDKPPRIKSNVYLASIFVAALFCGLGFFMNWSQETRERSLKVGKWALLIAICLKVLLYVIYGK